jgi:hypothetical protein
MGRRPGPTCLPSGSSGFSSRLADCSGGPVSGPPRLLRSCPHPQHRLYPAYARGKRAWRRPAGSSSTCVIRASRHLRARPVSTRFTPSSQRDNKRRSPGSASMSKPTRLPASWLRSTPGKPRRPGAQATLTRQTPPMYSSRTRTMTLSAIANRACAACLATALLRGIWRSARRGGLQRLSHPSRLARKQKPVVPSAQPVKGPRGVRRARLRERMVQRAGATPPRRR